MKRFVLIFVMVFSLQSAIAQEFEIMRHQVQLGETVRMISRKYKVEPAEIYRLNKFAVDGISQGMVLQLLVPKKEPAAETLDEPEQANSVVSKEDADPTTATTTTVTTIRKKQTTDGQTNPGGFPMAGDVETPNEASIGSAGAVVTHRVASGETLLSIARKYNMSLDQIKTQNESVLKRGLQIGQILTVFTSGVASPRNTVETTGQGAQTEVRHTVAKGETLYSLSMKYKVAVDEIKMQNEQALTNGLRVGQVLTIKAAN